MKRLSSALFVMVLPAVAAFAQETVRGSAVDRRCAGDRHVCGPAQLGVPSQDRRLLATGIL